MNVIDISLNKLTTVGNIREVTDDTEFQDLLESMGTQGQAVEIHVYPLPNGDYAIKFGHRRVEAARKLGWETIRAVVDDPVSYDELLLIQYAENDARKPLNYVEKAGVYQRLKDTGWSQKAIGEHFGLSAPAVSLALSVLRADKRIQDAVGRGDLSPSAVEPLLSQPLDVQERLADAVIRARTVRKIKALLDADSGKVELAKEPARVEEEDDDVDPLEEMAVSSLEEAINHLKLVEKSKITHPELVRRARPTVEQLLRLAHSLKKYLDGDGYEDLDDLG